MFTYITAIYLIVDLFLSVSPPDKRTPAGVPPLIIILVQVWKRDHAIGRA